MQSLEIAWNLPFALGAVVLLGVILYALFGGADFGGGIWDLLARGPRAEAQRQVIARAIGPVWEANHVWLIFVIVVVFTAFPPVFAALSTALYVPFSIALLGIVLRGAAFVFRSYAYDLPWARNVLGRTFAIASVITPATFGMAAGAVASGKIRFRDGEPLAGYWSSWLAPFPLSIGALALVICSYLAAIYLILETTGPLQEDFRRRAMGAGATFVVLAMLSLLLARSQAPRIWQGLTAEAWVFVPCALGSAALSAWAVWTRRFRLARLATAAAVVTLLTGWALAQYPYLVVPDLTFESSAAPGPTLRALIVVLVLGAVVLIPSLWLLFAVFKMHPAKNSPRGVPEGGSRTSNG